MTVTVTRPGSQRTGFQPLEVTAVDRLTGDALAVTFSVPEPLREVFAFQAGQHLTVRLRRHPGDDVRRSYSLSSTPAELAGSGRLRIGVKELPGGVFSQFAASELAVGDVVEVAPPLGRFTATPGLDRYVAVAAGSGITPVLSIVATVLAAQPASRFTVFYGNRYARSVMFADELSDLKDRWPDRLQVVHVLSREPGPARLLSGRIDADRLPRLLDTFLPGPADQWFLCGPYQLVLAARAVLAGRGVPEPAIYAELFHVPDEAPDKAPGRAPSPEPTDVDGGEVAVTVRLDGRSSTFTMGRHERVLDAALRVRGELPYSCRGGVCATCRARVIEGEVTMARSWALHPDERAAGFVLTCQATPTTDRLSVDYDG